MISNSLKSVQSFSWWLLRGSVMDRYIALELIGPFLFGVGSFSSVGVAIGTLFDLVRRVTEKGLPIEIAVQIFLLKLPDFIVLAFPMSVLLATLMGYSRMSADSEVVALRSCGVSVYRLVVPAIVLSFFVTLLTFAFNELIVPVANYQATVTLQQATNQDKPSFQDRNIIYTEFDRVTLEDGDRVTVMKRLFYAEEFDGERMKTLTILDRSQSSLNQIVAAESATWNPQENIWDFFNGTIYLIAPDGSYRNIVRFEHQQLKLPRTPLDLASRGRDYGEMNIAQSKERLKIIRTGGSEKNIRELEVRIQQKYALPFVCILFGLVGATLGLGPRRASKATSFGISIIIIFGYYLTAFLANALGQLAVLSAFMAAWLPMVLGLAIALVLLVRASR